MSSSSKAKRSANSSGWKFIPHSYQEEGIKWLISKSYNGLFWDPGLGKTATVLHAFDILQKKDFIDSVLIVAKKRIVRKTWPDEIRKWLPDLSISSIMGSEKQRIEAMRYEADVYLINYENLRWLCKNWKLNNFGRCWFVADESSKLRNINTKMFKTLRHKLKDFERRTILTGTPIPNGMINLFGQMYVVDLGESLGQYIGTFRNRYFEPTGYMGYQWSLIPGCEEQIYDAIADRILRSDSSELDLPELVNVTRSFTLSDDVMQLYKEMEEEFLIELESGVVTATNSAVASGKCRQIVNGAIFDSPDPTDGDDNPRSKKQWHPVHEEKIEELVELLQELNGKPALICYEYRHDRERIEKAILSDQMLSSLMPRKDGKPYVPYIGGGTKDKDADQYIDWWNEGALPVLLGHPESMAHGLNMQEVNAAVVFFSMTWNMENYEQFVRRVWRQGQEHPVFVYHLIAEGTIDERMMATIEEKQTNQQDLLNGLLRRKQSG